MLDSSLFARTPAPPYYVVVFSSLRSGADQEGYLATAERMLELAAVQEGFLGLERTRTSDGFGITASYWSSLEAIMQWRAHAEHRAAKKLGRESWYDHYEVRIARVERAWGKQPQT